MKKIILLLAILLAFSCERNSEDSLVFGKWEWVNSWISIGFYATPENTGINRVLILNEDYTSILIENEDTVQKGIFSLKREKSYLYDEYYDIITLDMYYLDNTEEVNTVTFDYLILELNDSILKYCGDAYDGGEHQYKRIR